jgi:hypothetical protein
VYEALGTGNMGCRFACSCLAAFFCPPFSIIRGVLAADKRGVALNGYDGADGFGGDWIFRKGRLVFGRKQSSFNEVSAHAAEPVVAAAKKELLLTDMPIDMEK